MTSTKAMTANRADNSMKLQVTHWAPRSPIMRPNRPAMMAPASGRNTRATSIASALHHIDVFNRDGAAIAEIDHQDRQADGGLRRRDRQHEHGENLPQQVAQMGGEGDEID